MYTPSQRWRIARSWLLSFLRSDRLPEHYPIDIREQSGVPLESTWFAHVLNWPGPSGLGSTKQLARQALLRTLQEIAAERWSRGEAMPRPGSFVPVEFASAERVNADPELLEEFIVKALGFNAGDPVFISDQTSIEDFGDELEVELIRTRIHQHFGVAVPAAGPTSVADLLVRIRAAR